MVNYGMHHDNALWPDPGVFNPERFSVRISPRPSFGYSCLAAEFGWLSCAVQKEGSVGRDKYAFNAFSHGPR
jgi:cytochrome P450